MLEDKLNLTAQVKKETMDKVVEQTKSSLRNLGLIKDGKDSQKKDQQEEANESCQRQRCKITKR